MFKFTMDAKDANCSEEKLAAAGIEVHSDRRIAADKVCFIAKERTPKDLGEALSIIQSIFYFPPICIWIDGKKLDPLKDTKKLVKVRKHGRAM